MQMQGGRGKKCHWTLGTVMLRPLWTIQFNAHTTLQFLPTNPRKLSEPIFSFPMGMLTKAFPCAIFGAAAPAEALAP